MSASALENGRATNRSGYMASLNEASDDITSPNQTNMLTKPTFFPVALSAIRDSGNGLARCMWMYCSLREKISSVCFYMRQFLQGIGCSEAELPPFLKITWERTETCLSQLHEFLCSYRSNYAAPPMNEQRQHIEKSDHVEASRQFNESARDAILKSLLQEEQPVCDGDLEDLQSTQSIADLFDDSSIDLIDDFCNFLPEGENAVANNEFHDASAYHSVMCKRLIDMSSEKAMKFVGTIAKATAELSLRQHEKGVDSLETEQKTLILQWTVSRAPFYIDELPADERFARNVVVKILNMKGKSKVKKKKRKSSKTNNDKQHIHDDAVGDDSLVIPGHYCIVCAYEKFYSKYYPRSNKDAGRKHPNKQTYRSIVRLLVKRGI